MNINMSYELTFSQQSNKAKRLFRWIIFGSTILLLISLRDYLTTSIHIFFKTGLTPLAGGWGGCRPTPSPLWPDPTPRDQC